MRSAAWAAFVEMPENPSLMDNIFLDTPFKDKDKVKALGARWDPALRKWYVPAGADLQLFSAWLPVAEAAASPTALPARQAPGRLATDLTVPGRGISLSQLLGGVSQAVSQAFPSGVWTLVEVLDARLRSGHVYVEVSERDAAGTVLAKAGAVIWASTAGRILPEFERATGAKLGPGIKLLVRARPVFKAQYGFSLEIDAIDPDYTLGDLEARKREIRTRLRQEQLFDANRRLPPPWDFNQVLVIAPQGAAGLGDFRAEAQRLERFGLCRFRYAFSRFQGEGAAAEIRQALLDALAQDAAAKVFDAVVIIRGGGAVNDLAWLNDYALARCLCESAIPVLTGIGHERDSTVLDEVANQSFDTPSKVVLGIEQLIVKRAAEAKAHFHQITLASSASLQSARRAVDLADAGVRRDAQRQLSLARQRVADRLGALRAGSWQAIQQAADRSRALVVEVRAEARQSLRAARAGAQVSLTGVLERAALDIRQAGALLDRQRQEVAIGARRALLEARTRSQALLREIAGQGPEKTLARGFALVRDVDGRTITRAAQVKSQQTIEITFSDGTLAARTRRTTGTQDP